jgi:hypothetical protein
MRGRREGIWDVEGMGRIREGILKMRESDDFIREYGLHMLY